MIGFDVVVQGILLGGLYALFATGLSLVFGIMRLVNLAHGDLIVMATYLLLFTTMLLGINPFVAVLIVAPLMFGVGWLLQKYLLNKVLGDDILPPILVTFGMSIVLQNLLLELWSADSQRLSVGTLDTQSISIVGINVGTMPLLTFISAVAVIFVLNRIFYTTRLGRALRATSDDAKTASLMGIRPNRMFAMATAIALVVCVISALYLGTRANFDPSIGSSRLLYAFEAVIIGGLGSLWGTLLGGIIIGVAQTVGGTMNPEWQVLSGHIAFLVVLLFRPRGLMPRNND